MSLSANTVWEVRTTGSSSNSGGFNVGNANMPTDLAATSATGSSPVVSSASYNFVSGDVGAWLFIKSGTNWVPGWYQIASVSAGSATLTASVGSVSLYGGSTVQNTSAGCATTASPSSGTWAVDYSQQASAQFAYTDLVIGSTTTQLTSSGHPFGVNCVGNLIQVASGTGFTTGWYEVVSVSSAIATMDRAVGTASSTGGHGSLGGCLDSLNTLSGPLIASNRAFIQAGSGYTTTSTITFAGGLVPYPNQPPIYITGYGTYRGDGGRATITLSTNTGLTCIKLTTYGWFLQNLYINCNSLATSTGIQTTQYTYIYNCKVANFKSYGININNSQCQILYCEVTGGLSGANAGISNPSGYSSVSVYNCWVHDNVCTGINIGGGTIDCVSNLITNNTGTTSDGIAHNNNASGLCFGNTVYNSGRNGICTPPTAGSVGLDWTCLNNLIVNSGGWGITFSTTGWPAHQRFDGNAFYNNTSGNRNSINDLGTTNAIDGVAPYVNQLDVILTANPFVNTSINDFRLNTTSGGGASCRGYGVFGTWSGNSNVTSYRDMGAAQSRAGGRRPRFRQLGA
jgi:hypothetical protein